jgi:zinc protease
MLPRLLCLIALLWLPSAALAYEPVQEFSSPQGHKIWLIENHQLPIVSLRLRFQHAGYTHDPEAKEGLANLLTDMLFEGAGDYDAKTLHQMLDTHGIAPNVSAGPEYLDFHIKFLSQHADKVTNILHAILQAPHFQGDALATTKARINSRRKQSEQSPGYLANRLWNEKAFEGHPLARDPSGSNESLATITAEDLRQFMREHVTTDRLLITIAGDATPPTASTWVDAILEGLPTSANAAQMPIATTTVQQAGTYRHPIDSSQTTVAFGVDALTRTHPDFYTLYVLNYILGGGSFESELTQRLREEKGLVYSVYSYLSASDLAPSLRGGLATRADQVVDATSELKQIMARLQKGAITQAMVDDAKQHIIGSLPLKTDTTAKLSSYMMHARQHQLGKDYLKQRASYFEAVTLQDVKRVANNLLKPESLVITIAGPEAKQ